MNVHHESYRGERASVVLVVASAVARDFLARSKDGDLDYPHWVVAVAARWFCVHEHGLGDAQATHDLSRMVCVAHLGWRFAVVCGRVDVWYDFADAVVRRLGDALRKQA